MKNTWSQPSLSRDFALLAAAILFVLFLISAWVSYATYNRHASMVSRDLKREAVRIEHMLASEMETASYMLTSLGRQIILNKDQELVSIAKILKSFDSRGYIYSIFSFINDRQRVVVSSNRGVLDKPVDISDRDYIKMALAEPWKMHIGHPIKGRVSGRWVIPVSMGLTDYTGKYIGSLLISLDINILTDSIENIIIRDGISFAVTNKELITLSQATEKRDFFNTGFPLEKLQDTNFATEKNGLLSQGNLFVGSNIYSYYLASDKYPYIILLNYDAFESDENIRNQLWSRLLQVLGFAVFFVMFLWIMRARMIRPVLQLTEVAKDIARGEAYHPIPKGGPEEIEGLSKEMGHISEYISEIRRIEDELRNKMFMLKKSKEVSDIENRSKSEFLDYICQELRGPTNNIITLSQAMKDELYGPIENGKYRQCSTDINQVSKVALAHIDGLLAFNRAEEGYTKIDNKKEIALAPILEKVAINFEQTDGNKTTIKVDASDDLPKLVISEFRLRQTLTNLLSYAVQTSNVETLHLEARSVSENKDAPYVLISIASDNAPNIEAQEMRAIAENLLDKSLHRNLQQALNVPREEGNLSLELVKMLTNKYHAGLDIHIADENTIQIFLIFGRNQIGSYTVSEND